MKSISAIHLAITEKMENILVKCTPHISIRESHNASMSNIYNDVTINKTGVLVGGKRDLNMQCSK